MVRASSESLQAEIVRALHALGGQGTPGDLIAATGLPRLDVERSLEALMADERVHVMVLESATVLYGLRDRRSGSRPADRRWLAVRKPPKAGGGRSRGAPMSGSRPFDRKTIQLIRARDGVLSLAELVEHTGQPLREAEAELRRLAELYGGEPHDSWDGHVVYAFPELMASLHGRLDRREPRPAWVRAEDPLRGSRRRRPGHSAEATLNGLGLLTSAAVPWLALLEPGVATRPLPMALIVGACAAALVVCARNLRRAILRAPRNRYRNVETVRRYALGYVFETALKGKGVVSLARTVAYLQARAGKRTVSRTAVRLALTRLASEFDAPVTELNGDLFFGFRDVKRQFLASHVQRSRLKLGRLAVGSAVYDSEDSPLAACERDLQDFDRALQRGEPARVG